MIDYKYTDIFGITPSELFNNKLLDFQSPVSLKTGEVCPQDNINRSKNGYKTKNEKEAIYNDIKFIITNDKYINFSGSVHEYFCNGTNHTDFTFYDLFQVTKDLFQKFKINPFLEDIHNIEIGVNVLLPFSVKTLLDSIIICKGKEYELRKYNGRGFMLKFKFHQYEIKIYDKGFQKQLPDNILRFELKVTRMSFLRNKKILIHSSTDILKPEIHYQFGQLLGKIFNQIIMFDERINIKKLSLKEQKYIIEKLNPKYWSKLRKSNPETYKKRLKRFQSVSNKHSQIHGIVSELIKRKWDIISQIDNEKLKEIEQFLNEIKPKTFPEITAQNKKVIELNFPEYYTSNSEERKGNHLPEKRYCKTCKRDISEQNKKSIFCSEKYFGREAKKCRNIDSNPRNHFKSRERKIKEKGLLFDIDDYMKFATK